MDRISIPGSVENFLLSTSSRPVLRTTQPPIQWVTDAISSTVKRSGRESHHLPPINSKVKNTLIYTTNPHTFSWRKA
jgi:hypothetical protein